MYTDATNDDFQFSELPKSFAHGPQVESLDAEIEGMANAKKKAKPQPKLLHLEEATSRHKQHITRLEQVCPLQEKGHCCSCLPC